MTSRNKREGHYGGKASAFEAVKTLANDRTIWRRDYVRHARYKSEPGLMVGPNKYYFVP